MKLDFIVNSLDLFSSKHGYGFYFTSLAWGMWFCVKARTLWRRLLFLAIAGLAALTWGIGLFVRFYPKFAYVYAHPATLAMNCLLAILLAVGLFQASRQPETQTEPAPKRRAANSPPLHVIL